MRLTTVLADGTSLELQQEVTLDEFMAQLTAAADGLGGGESPLRRGWSLSREQAQLNNRVGDTFENVSTAPCAGWASCRSCSGRFRRGGFDLVTLEDETVVINDSLVTGIYVNEAKFQNRLQYDDFGPITSAQG